jgi:hypothetical protein
MENPADLNSPQYVISDLTSTSQQVTVEPNYIGNYCRVIIDNSLSSTPAFVKSGTTTQTAVYPTSATVASAGTIVAAGAVMMFNINPKHGYIAAIRESGTADLAIKLATGE